MTATCSYCRGPIIGAGFPGRDRENEPVARYCCFGCLDLGETFCNSPNCEIARGIGLRLGIGVLVAGQSMIFGLALNLHDEVPPTVRWVTQALILCGTMVVVSLLGWPLFRAALTELRRGRVTIETLFLLTLGGALAASFQAFATGRGAIYFEVVSVLLVVYTLGKLIGARARAAAMARTQQWANKVILCRRIEVDGQPQMIPADALEPGDWIDIYPGERVAVSGVIRTGIGFLSEAPVTGGPFLVARQPGERVLAGSISFDATFRIEVTQRGITRQEFARVVDSPQLGLVDRLSRLFTPCVLATSLGTFFYWSLLTDGGWDAALFNAMSVLLVACPCALGLAAPLVMWSALARFAAHGLVVSRPSVVERLATIDRVLLDKTGTLTEERSTIRAFVLLSNRWERAEVLHWLALVESQSRHPIARAFADFPLPDHPARVEAFRFVPGAGVEASLVVANGVVHEIRVGMPLSTHIPHDRHAVPPHGRRVDVSIDGEHAAIAYLSEQVRESAREMLEAFRDLGVPVEIVTGDSDDRPSWEGMPAVRAGLMPESKRKLVERLSESGHRPLMVGDGINDAPALAAAHVGVALASGTDLAVEAADATLYTDDLRVLPWAVALSQDAIATVRRNCFRALAFNLVGMTLAAFGLLHPVVAALFMVISSLTLVFSASRLGTKPIHCAPPGRNHFKISFSPVATALHFGAIVLQGVLLASLSGWSLSQPEAMCLLGGFALMGALLTGIWRCSRALPHSLDMAFGMLTVGNLGMLLGWCFDNHFAAVHCTACCSCSDPLTRPGMWLGMLVFANAAMFWLGRRSAMPTREHILAMFTGGNVGMMLGMLAGGWCATQLGAVSGPGLVAVHFVGMTVGMVGGMIAGTRIVEVILVAFAVRSSKILPDEVVDREAEADQDDCETNVLRR